MNLEELRNLSKQQRKEWLEQASPDQHRALIEALCRELHQNPSLVDNVGLEAIRQKLEEKQTIMLTEVEQDQQQEEFYNLLLQQIDEDLDREYSTPELEALKRVQQRLYGENTMSEGSNLKLRKSVLKFLEQQERLLIERASEEELLDDAGVAINQLITHLEIDKESVIALLKEMEEDGLINSIHNVSTAEDGTEVETLDRVVTAAFGDAYFHDFT